ncbi:LysE family translocator [Pinisolibacter sp.]|uniref:LysE family translocator n=1 Tax=Pinisolibacter sp. TaxID=2172024 RepID=UPI002FDCE9D2
MIDVWLLITGIGVGIVFSAPVGPVNILCVQRAFRGGFFSGLAAGLGAATADTFFAAIAAYGVTAVSGFVEGHSDWLQAIGGLFLVIFGLRIANAHPHLDENAPEPASLLSTTIATFGMTITNPATVLGFLALFGSLGDLAPRPGDWLGAGFFVLGVAAGASGWWFFVSAVVAMLRDRMTDDTLFRVNRLAGGLLVLFGVAMVGRLLIR